MADNDQNNDEYKFSELDSLDNESMGDSEQQIGGVNTKGSGSFNEKKDVRRNALIVVGLIIFALVMYKFIGYLFSGKSEQVKPDIPTVANITPKAPTTIQPTPVSIKEPQPVVPAVDPELKQKIAAIEITQQTFKSEVVSVGGQVRNLNDNINNLNTQITRLNQMIESLSNQVSRQSEEIKILRVCNRPKPVKPITKHHIQRVIYYIKAVIPGRAWLIGSNGSTLTVREGTNIPGYGVVRLIDSLQGRVLTSSGQVIKFSQDDS